MQPAGDLAAAAVGADVVSKYPMGHRLAQAGVPRVALAAAAGWGPPAAVTVLLGPRHQVGQPATNYPHPPGFGATRQAWRRSVCGICRRRWESKADSMQIT